MLVVGFPLDAHRVCIIRSIENGPAASANKRYLREIREHETELSLKVIDLHSIDFFYADAFPSIILSLPVKSTIGPEKEEFHLHGAVFDDFPVFRQTFEPEKSKEE